MGHPFHESVTATALARNLSVMIDRVRVSRRSLYITKASLTIAELGPPPKSGYPVSKLAELFDSLPKLGDDRKPMRSDLTSIRKRAILPESPWD
jgi:hypothetical protein